VHQTGKIASFFLIILIINCSPSKKSTSSLLKSLPEVSSPILDEARTIEPVNLSLKMC